MLYEEELTANEEETAPQIEKEEGLPSLPHYTESLKTRPFHFIRSHFAKTVQMTDERKARYLTVKNAVLCYHNAKCKISEKNEILTVNGTFVCRIAFRAQVLCAFFPLPDDSPLYVQYLLEREKGEMADEGKISESHAFVRLTKDTDVAAALAAVEAVLATVKKARKNDTYAPLTVEAFPYVTTETLLNAGQIKINVANHVMEVKKPYNPLEVKERDVKDRIFHLNKSYVTKLFQLPDDRKQVYLAIVNTVLSYARTKTRISWKRETLSMPGKRLCAITVKGKSITVYLPLSVADLAYTQIGLQSCGDAEDTFPSYLRITSERQLDALLDYLKTTIENGKKPKYKGDFELLTEDDVPYRTTETLLNVKQIKLVVNNAKIGSDIAALPEEAEKEIEKKNEDDFLKQLEEEDEKTIDLGPHAIRAVEKINGKLVAEIKPTARPEIHRIDNVSILPKEKKDIYDSKIEKDAEVEGGLFEYRKEYYLRSIDESWVKMIEEVLPTIHRLTKSPSRTLQEEEEIVFSSLAKKVGSRSVRHLLQHVENIAEVKEDGDVIPEKLLNVYMDETIKTYENRFLNTLIYRMFSFINKRYEAVKRELESEVKSTLTMEEVFHHKSGAKGRVQLRVEYSEEPKETSLLKNYQLNSDLWARVERLNKESILLMNSPFCIAIGKDYIRPPVMRTNAILKNVGLKQCLALWQFLEGYEKAGYKMLVRTEVLEPTQPFYEGFCRQLANKYIAFVRAVKESEEDMPESTADFSEEELFPEIKEAEDTPLFAGTDFDGLRRLAKGEKPAVRETATLDKDAVCDAVAIALQACRKLNERKGTDDGNEEQ